MEEEGVAVVVLKMGVIKNKFVKNSDINSAIFGYFSRFYRGSA